MGISCAHLLAFSVTLEPRLFILVHEMVVKADLVALLIVDRLQAQVLEKPDELIHDAGRFSQLLGAAPGTFAKTAFHVLSHLEILIHLNKQIASLTELLD